MRSLPKTKLSANNLKHWVYDKHGVVTFMLILVVFTAWACVPSLQSWSFLSSGVGAILGLSYFALKQHLEEIRLFKDLFSNFNSRYDAINWELNALLDESSEKPLARDQIRLLYDYFNLCAEEYLYYQKGFIYPEVWNAWYNGMKIFGGDPRIRALWERELQTDSYYGFSLALPSQ